MGESAGGASVHFLLTSPRAQGLAARAVILSGGDPVSQHGLTPLASVEAAGDAFARGKGIAADDPAALERLRALSGEAVVSDLNLSTLGKPDGTASPPFPDGKIAASPGDAYAAGRFAHVPVMVGATSNDIGGPTGAMAAGARRVAALLAGQKVPAYYYRFSYVAASLGAKPGADHASDIPYFMATEAIKYGEATTARDREAGRLASGYLVNFVRTGDPNGAGLPLWPAYSPASEAMLDLSADGSAVPGPDPLAKKLEAASAGER